MIGADIVDIRRIAEAIKSERFAHRVFTQNEISYAQKKHNSIETFAGMFAAKEAVSKLSGKGLRGFNLTDIEIAHTDLGAPTVVLHGKAKELFPKDVHISISHEKDYAFAVASLEPSSFTPVMPGKEITDGDLTLLPRERFTHKGDYGRVYVIGGSSLMVGAPFICAEAAVRSGAGLTTLCVPTSLLDAYRQRVKEVMLKGIMDNAGEMTFDKGALSDIIAKADTVVIGMGVGNYSSLSQILEFLFTDFGGTLVCDADAINALSADPKLLEIKRKCSLILTPHIGEFNRLSKALGIENVADCALKIDAVIACKSAYTVVTDGVTTYNVTSGCAAMAKGGSGDTLAGIIAAYSCRTTPLEATALACHYFGRCGEKAAKLKGENAVTATDIINCL
ncbi:MAG: NAD(P)H-hydrate dehydratase [Clostridiales bacterium]|nr:NAD(P)H-hydrate dehydratase [Clostridiales bacterium]